MKGYTYEELLEYELNPTNYEQCQECELWYPIGELVDDEENEAPGTAIAKCPNCL